ncbi:hypothetical protein T492DRAFT_950668 [Pavlovales sp. CCMP2436]|nr:hypothetical protein T492DRAFT_950668 [Pavlovales sp. CCMP2436]
MTAAQSQGATVYVRNLNERVKLDAMKAALRTAFAPFGEVVDVNMRTAFRMRGQAFVSLESVEAAVKAVATMAGFELFGKFMDVTLARERSDTLTKADGTFIPRERRREEALAAEEAVKEEEAAAAPTEAAAEPMEVASSDKAQARAKAPIAASARQADPVAAAALVRTPVPSDENVPNEKLFLQGLPAELDDMALQMLFQQFQGFKESRTVPGRVGIAFVEFNLPAQASIARERLQGFKLTDEHFMQISFAKR